MTTQTDLILPNTAYDLRRTMWPAGMGQRDPTLHVSADNATLGFVSPDGPVRVEATRESDRLLVCCFGQGASWIEPRLSKLFGLHDRPEEFQPEAKMADLLRKFPGAHLPTLPIVFHRLVQVVLQQLVSWSDAIAGWCKIVDRFGTDAPLGNWSDVIRLPPAAKTLSELGYFDLVECGVLPKQARLILRLSREATRINRLANESSKALEKYLLSINGIGDWTVQHLLGCACGQADAVMTGDYGLPHTVAWALAQKERSDDEEMLRLLEPFRGHRFRVINLLWQSGIEAPRRGPKLRTNQWRFRVRHR